VSWFSLEYRINTQTKIVRTILKNNFGGIECGYKGYLRHHFDTAKHKERKRQNNIQGRGQWSHFALPQYNEYLHGMLICERTIHKNNVRNKFFALLRRTQKRTIQREYIRDANSTHSQRRHTVKKQFKRTVLENHSTKNEEEQYGCCQRLAFSPGTSMIPEKRKNTNLS